MNYSTEIATWILKCTFMAYHCVPPLRSPASLGILRWGTPLTKNQRWGRSSPACYYTLTTVRNVRLNAYVIQTCRLFRMRCREGRGMGRSVSLPGRLGVLAEHHKLSQRGPGWSTSRPQVLAHFERDDNLMIRNVPLFLKILQKWDFTNAAWDSRNKSRKRENSAKSRKVDLITVKPIT